ncbi:GTPase IMAP family member 2-like [Odontesthes bonariensis]|uniref:GTPase IMAP family member 2-like n=1 Tax=Odontesthes bonariensis TaxID=219752 RepID=UPI003F5896DC
MSELNIVLLGNSCSEREKVTDFIKSASDEYSERDVRGCRRFEFQVKGEKIFAINPPNLLSPDISQNEIEEHVETSLSLSEPGPHVLLLVLQPEDLTEDQNEKLCGILKLFGDRPFDHSLVLISTPREEKPGFMEEYRQHPALKDMIEMCRYRYLWFKNLEVPELLARIGQIVKENRGEHLKR